jgi:hypothetical protein
MESGEVIEGGERNCRIDVLQRQAVAARLNLYSSVF